MTANVVERAFEIARDGSARSLEDIKRKLASEKFTGIDSHLAGPALRKQLKALMGPPVLRAQDAE